MPDSGLYLSVVLPIVYAFSVMVLLFVSFNLNFIIFLGVRANIYSLTHLNIYPPVVKHLPFVFVPVLSG